MESSADDWSADSTKAVNISLVQADGGSSKTLYSFNPRFTYPIFGDEESIFGYKGLKINLRFHASDMRPNLQVTYSKKFQAIGDTEPTDINAAFEDFLPMTAYEKQNVFQTAISDPTSKDWTPAGKLVETLTVGDKTYEVWMGNLLDPAVLQAIKRIQVLVPLFIEGGTFIALDDPEWSLKRWTVFFLYEKKSGASASPYVFMGYSTVYRYYHYHPMTPPASPNAQDQHSNFTLPLAEASSEQCRSRISQFVILPPFQGGGHGARLYNTIFSYYLANPDTIEITVEDPNEAFDDLRDLNDLIRLRQNPEFTKIRLNTKVKINKREKLPTSQMIDKDALEQIRLATKIAPRQFYRVVEMQLLSNIPLSIRQSLIFVKKTGDPENLKRHERDYYLWKLLTKQRLYKHNKEQLIQMDRSERLDSLEQTVGGVEADYARLLRKLEPKAESSSNGASKRSAPEDDEEPTSKRAKTVEME